MARAGSNAFSEHGVVRMHAVDAPFPDDMLADWQPSAGKQFVWERRNDSGRALHRELCVRREQVVFWGHVLDTVQRVTALNTRYVQLVILLNSLRDFRVISLSSVTSRVLVGTSREQRVTYSRVTT